MGDHEELEEEVKRLEEIVKEEKQDAISRGDKYRLRINQLESKLLESEEKYQDAERRYEELKKDLNMVGRINANQRKELTESTQNQIARDELIREINILKKRAEQKTQEIEELKDKNLELRLTLKEKSLELKRQEEREEQLVSEINALKIKNKDFEDKFTSEKVEGNNHIGLRKIDFINGGSHQPNSSKSSHVQDKNKSREQKNWVINQKDFSKNSSLVADIGHLKISEASQRLESSDYKESDIDTEVVETGLVMNLQHSMKPGDVELSSSLVKEQGLSNIELNAPPNNFGNKIEEIDNDEETIPANNGSKNQDMDSSFEMGLPLNIGGNALMGGDDDSEDNELALPESMLQSTVNFPFENNKKLGGGQDLYSSFEEDDHSETKTDQSFSIKSSISGKHKLERVESRASSRAESIVQNGEKLDLINQAKKEHRGDRNSFKPGINANRKSKYQQLGVLNDPNLMQEINRFSVRSSINRQSYLQFNMMNLDVAIKALADQTDDFSLYKDYLNMASRMEMDTQLSKFGDKDVDGCCFSDYIWVFDNKMRRKRKRILITGQFIYIFSESKKWKLHRNYPLSSLTQIAISAKNYTLMLLSFTQNFDLLIDSYRRLDIILYIVQRMRFTKEVEKHPDFKLIYLKNFRLRKRNREEVELNYKEGMKGELKILQETFRNSKRSGYLKLRKKRALFGYNWSTYFFMASNIGLIYFKTFGVSSLKALKKIKSDLFQTGRSSGFIPYHGARIRAANYNEFSKHHVFVIDFGSKLKVVFQAQSDIDKDEWIEAMLHYVGKAVTSEDNFQTMESKMMKKKGKKPAVVQTAGK